MPSTASAATGVLDFAAVAGAYSTYLTAREKNIIAYRFGLNGKGSLTLQQIGDKMGVTRERIRQLQDFALQKINENLTDSTMASLSKLIKLAQEIIAENGGIAAEEKIVSEILNHSQRSSQTDKSFIQLALTVDSKTQRFVDRQRFETFWALSSVKKENLEKVEGSIVSVLKDLKKGELSLDFETLFQRVFSFAKEKHGLSLEPELVRSVVDIWSHFAELDGQIGLSEWRWIRPRSVIDKSIIVLRRAMKPMHFTEINDAIINARFDNKTCQAAATHNELIKAKEIVLVGRGTYGLREWGKKGGQVIDLLVEALEKAKKPLSRDELIASVLKHRDAKESTIMVNATRSKKIERTADGLYQLKK